MWSDRDADDAHCPGSGTAAEPAARAADGYPHGRALCPVCWGFVVLHDGALGEHDSWRGEATREETERRRAWLNAHGW
ncbi:hypothetical protein ACIQLJ_15915 [Microbacterium sp. NPDC091313]